MSKVKTIVNCYHCGDPCDGIPLQKESKSFCCQGCLSVYELLNSAGMNDFYSWEKQPGIKAKENSSYLYLDDPEIEKKIILFANDKQVHVKLHLPSIHCNSCIWLLENLNRLNDKIISCSVNFLKKEASIVFSRELKFSELAHLLHKIGYVPDFSLQSSDNKSKKKDKSLIYKLGIAGFCFGNIMLLSLPSYLGADFLNDRFYMMLFGYTQIFLSLPIVFYVSADYFRSAYYALKTKTISIDIPLSLGITVLFARSVFEIISSTGVGYLDSLAGLLFFLMIGKWFQKSTYDNIVFDRDYKSYFPISVSQWVDGEEKPLSIEKVKEGDILIIRNGELIPCDAILLSSEATLDYSFVTGETELITKNNSEHLFSGARLSGTFIKIKALKGVDQSYLTQLWNNKVFHKEDENNLQNLLNKTSKYFTIAILLIAATGTIYWWMTDPSRILDAVTEIFIITCPCAFALSVPFTMGNIIRYFGKHQFYLKDAEGIEKMAEIKEIVFDKTGTITYLNKKNVSWIGEDLTEEEKAGIYALCNNSTHPFSRSITHFLSSYKNQDPVTGFHESVGKGIKGMVKNKNIKIGSANFVGAIHSTLNSVVFVSINNVAKGYFEFKQLFREDTENLLAELEKNYPLHLLSGDKKSEDDLILKHFSAKRINFEQTPLQKLEYIEHLQNENKKVSMVGDGLNDAGALAASHFGVTISDDLNTFTPSSDAILKSKSLSKLPQFFQLAKEGITIIKISFLLSFLYNLVGLYFAFSGAITPLFAAILMPISSITIILFVTLVTKIRGNRILEKSVFQSN